MSDGGRFLRWWRFNAVGLIGIAVQAGALWALKNTTALPLAWATALSVEIAVLHNFAWHELWTWRERRGPGMWGRLLRFNVSNGLVSMAVNVLAVQALTTQFHIHYMVANLAGTGCGAVLNFLLGEFFVFRSKKPRAMRVSAPR